MSSKAQSYYPTDLSDGQWALIEPLLPAPRSGPGLPGRPANDRRVIVNGILYVVKGGIQWRLLPREFGAWQTAYRYFNTWSAETVWQEVMEALNGLERRRQGRQAEPSAGCVDSQSIDAAMQPTDHVGVDGHKQVRGRKRHVLTDTLGLILFVVVTAANVDDRRGLRALVNRWFMPGVSRIRKLWVDAGYVGEAFWQWVWSIKATHKIDLEVVGRQGKGFQVVKKRWVVERTFGWFLGHRRNSKDYEVLPRNSEAMIHITMIAILLRRLA